MMSRTLPLFFLGLLVFSLTNFACTRSNPIFKENETPTIYSPFFVSEAMKSFMPCSSVPRLEEARHKIQEGRRTKKLENETLVSVVVPGENGLKDYYFTTLEECQKFTRGLEWEGYKPHTY